MNRNLLNKLNKLLAVFPVVVILGARQCGKTSLCKMARPDWEYFDLERASDRRLIESDMELFFKNHGTNLIIDEAQEVPALFSFLRGYVDRERNRSGRFILTGSSSPELTGAVSESLAGRVGLLELSPFKTNELFGNPLPPFYSICGCKIDASHAEYLRTLEPVHTFEQVQQVWLNGGYPEPSLKPPEFRPIWTENYIATYLERDLRKLFPSLEIEKFRLFLTMLKDFHSQILNAAEFSRAIGASESTIRRYLEITHGLFIWRKLSAYERSSLRSLVKNPRGMYRDSGLFHFFNHISSVSDLETSRYRGASFESFVIEEILRGVACTDATMVNSYYFRTRSGAEVDLIIEGSFGTLPIEIKASSWTDPKDTAALGRFISDHDLPFGLVINLSDRVEALTPKIIQIPAGMI